MLNQRTQGMSIIGGSRNAFYIPPSQLTGSMLELAISLQIRKHQTPTRASRWFWGMLLIMFKREIPSSIVSYAKRWAPSPATRHSSRPLPCVFAVKTISLASRSAPGWAIAAFQAWYPEERMWWYFFKPIWPRLPWEAGSRWYSNDGVVVVGGRVKLKIYMPFSGAHYWRARGIAVVDTILAARQLNFRVVLA